MGGSVERQLHPPSGCEVCLSGTPPTGRRLQTATILSHLEWCFSRERFLEGTICCRWYRDPALPVPRSEVTRFPHAVLEVKLSLQQGQEAPEWVRDLIDSGYLTEVGDLSAAALLTLLLQLGPLRLWLRCTALPPGGALLWLLECHSMLRALSQLI